MLLTKKTQVIHFKRKHKKCLRNIRISKSYIVIFFFCLLGLQKNFGQGTKLFFKSTDSNTVTIFVPVDGYVNFFETPSFEISLEPEVEVCFKPVVEDFAFIQISYSNGSRYSLLIHNGDSLHIYLNKNTLYFSGINSSGQAYLNNFNRSINVDSIFEQHLKNGIDIQGIKSDIKSLFFDGLKSDLAELISTKKVTSTFGDKIFNDMSYAVADMFVSSCEILLKGMRNEILTQSDTIAIRNALDTLFKDLPPNDKSIIKYRYSYKYIKYYNDFMFNKYTEKQKNELIKNYSKDTFGPYISYILAPDYIQCPLFGSALLLQINYMLNEFDKSKMYDYLNQKFPNSQYLSIISEKLIPEKQKKSNLQLKDSLSETVYIDKAVHSIKELLLLPELKGKKVYIDIWATWCMPCKAQFQYNDKIHELAQKNNVTLVYISIDSKEFINKWMSDIEKSNLKGFHIMANEDLLNDIKNVFFEDKTVSIPRYIFYDTNGKLMNSNAPRPSNLDEIKKMFSYRVKQ